MTKTIDTLQVTKRNGSLEAFDLTQIREAINFAVGDTGLNPLKLETTFTQGIYDGVETSKIQDSLIVAAANLVSAKEPNWKYVAGRLITWSRQHRLSKLGINYEPETLYSYTVTKLDEGIYSELLRKYTKEQLLTAFSWINPDYDHDYDIFGAEILEKRYLLKDEPLQLACILTALIIAIPEKSKDARMKFAFKLYHAVAQRKISLATPILANMRKAKGSISSCFIITMEDDLKSIYREITNAAFISKNGGGVGCNVSRIRAVGSEVMGNDNASGGVIPWIKLLNDTAIAVNQGGRRAGAITVSLDIWHLDILEFLEMQTENGDQRRKAYDVFPQIVLNDVFNEAVKVESDWYLVCPYEIKKYYGVEIAALWGDEFKEFYSQLKVDINAETYQGRHKTVNAKDLFKSIMRTCVETGLPYLVQKDEINRANPNKHEGMIPGTNLCVAPETKIVVKHKLENLDQEIVEQVEETTISVLAGKTVDIWNGFEWSEVEVVKTGENQKLFRVLVKVFGANPSDCFRPTYHSLDCTGYHKWFIRVRDEGGIPQTKKVETKDLTKGNILIEYKCPYSGVSLTGEILSIEDTGRISDTYCFTEHKRNMGMFNGILTGQCVESFSNTGMIQLPNGEKQKVAHTCNLISLNLHTINTFSPELEEMCRIAVRALDNSIDVNTPSFEDSKIHNQRYRTIGVGTMGLADWMVKNNLRYSKISDKNSATYRLVSDLYENIAYFTAMESVELAKERGTYPAYEGSEWSKGFLLGSKSLSEIQEKAQGDAVKWEILKDAVRKHGIRNSQITAIAPNTSSALVQGCTASILPVFSRMFEEKWSKGKMFNSPPLIAENPMAYEENIHLDQNHIIDFVKLVQFWIDTGISMEFVFNPNEGAYFNEGVYYEANPKHVFDVLTKSFDGIKAVYYQRFVSKGESEKSVCFVCAN